MGTIYIYMILFVCLFVLPGPFPRMGAWPKATEAKEPGNTPWTVPQVKNRRSGTEDSRSTRRGGRARKKKMGEVLSGRPTSRTSRRRRTAYAIEVRGKKKRVAVAAKTGQDATGTAGEGALLSRHRGDWAIEESAANR